MSDDQPSTSTFKKFQFEDDNLLISEVKKRRLLWDRKHRQFGNRTGEWQVIASILNRTSIEVKTRFRNLRDTFHKEEKKAEFRSADEGKTLLIYTGHWVYFEKLLFLHGNRNAEEYVDDNVKGFNLSEEHSNDSDDGIFEVQIEDENKMFPDTCTEKNDSDNNDHAKKSCSKNERDRTVKRKRTAELLPTDSDTDDDVLFVKSLVPFFNKLNPLKRLIVKNEMQNLLIKEMFCGRCRLIGPQPNCCCNLNE